MKSIRTVAAAALAAAAIGAGAALPAAAAPTSTYEKAIAKRNAKIERLERQVAIYQATIAKRNARAADLAAQVAEAIAGRNAASAQLSAVNAKLADLPAQIRALTPDTAWGLVAVIAERLQGSPPYLAQRIETPMLNGPPVVTWVIANGVVINLPPIDPPLPPLP